VLFELEVSGNLLVDARDEDRHLLAREMLRELIVTPRQPIAPMPALTNVAIERAVDVGRAGVQRLDARADVARACRA
jgi:hypothetical protein